MFVPLEPNAEAREYLDKMSEHDRNDAVKNYVSACVRTVIVLGQQGKAIKKSDLNKLAFPLERNYRLLRAIIQLANKELYRVFGMRLYDVVDKDKYLLVNMGTDFAQFQHKPAKEEECMAYLYLVLTEIFQTPDQELALSCIRGSLAAFEISDDDLSEHLDELVKKLYLNRVKRQEEVYFSWGPRALAEINLDKFFELFLETTNDTAREWPELATRIDRLKAIRHH